MVNLLRSFNIFLVAAHVLGRKEVEKDCNSNGRDHDKCRPEKPRVNSLLSNSFQSLGSLCSNVARLNFGMSRRRSNLGSNLVRLISLGRRRSSLGENFVRLTFGLIRRRCNLVGYNLWLGLSPGKTYRSAAAFLALTRGPFLLPSATSWCFC